MTTALAVAATAVSSTAVGAAPPGDVEATAPGVPTITKALAGNGSASVTWNAPASNGGAAIDGYVVTPYVGAVAQAPRTFNSTATTQSVTGLANGTTYTFRVAARNSIGTGTPSAASIAVKVGTPAAPGLPAAQPGNGTARVAWFASAANGSAISGYVITPYIGATAQAPQSFATTATNATVTGLANGTAYTFRVAAVNSFGAGATSVTPALTVGVPAAPATPTAAPGTTSAKVSWWAPGANGSAITGYVVTPMIGATAQTPVVLGTTATSYTVTGLTTGGSYSFKVAAVNARGTGPATQSAVIVVGSPMAPPYQSAVPGNGTAVVKFLTPPANAAPLTGFTVWPVQGSTVLAPRQFATPASQALTVTGLANGTAYTFRVAATNSVGTGPASTTNSVVAGTPANPSLASAQPGNGTAKVSWWPPAANASPITSYVITPFIGATAQAPQTFVSTASNQTVTGLANGTAYTFKVAAVNAIGSGPQGSPTAAVTVGTPVAPGSPKAAPGNGLAVVSWTAPAANASPITSYVITPFISSTAQAPQVFASTATTQSVTGLVNGTTYTFRVAAVNSTGTGPYTTTAALKVGVPGTPTQPAATRGPYAALVNWTAPADNGSAVTGYVVTPHKAGVAQAPVTFDASSTSRPVDGLAAGASYTFTVAAVNARGISAPSPASSAVTPSAGPTGFCPDIAGLDKWTWGGAVNSDWGIAGNWIDNGVVDVVGAGVPATHGQAEDADDYVCIPAGKAPVLSAGQSARPVVLDNAGTLTVLTNGRLELTGAPVTQPSWSHDLILRGTLHGRGTLVTKSGGTLTWDHPTGAPGPANMSTRFPVPSVGYALPAEPGRTVIAAGAVMEVRGEGMNLWDGRTIDNFGTTRVVDAVAYIAADYGTTFRNAGAFEFQSDGDYHQGFTRGLATRSRFINTGSLTKTGGSATSFVDASYSVTEGPVGPGTAQVGAGTLSILSDGAVVTVLPGASFSTGGCGGGGVCANPITAGTGSEGQFATLALPGGATQSSVDISEATVPFDPNLRGRPVDLAVPTPGTSAANPMILKMAIDDDLLGVGETHLTLDVTHNDGPLLPDCVAGPPQAQCVDRSASTTVGGDVVMVIRTASNGRWKLRL